MPLLHLLQERDKFISGEAIRYVAEKLGLEPINVWELVSFYPAFKEKPLGKLHIRICKGLTCMLKGAGATAAELERLFNCKIGHTRDDGAVSLEWVECMAACDKAPVMMSGETLHGEVTPEKARGLLK